MGSRYIPPHMRTKDGGVLDVPKYSGSRKLAYKKHDLDEHYKPAGGSSLRLSVTNGIVYIPVFWLQHPHWQDRRELFIKSNLDSLPGHPDDYPKEEHVEGQEQNHGAPIPVFEEIKPIGYQKGGRDAGFHFVGYYTISAVKYLEPHSEELSSMQKEKWTTPSGKERERNSAAWKESLSLRWAVVKLEPVPDPPDPPKIEINEEPTRGVNEMLKDMRLKDGTAGNPAEDRAERAKKLAAWRDVGFDDGGRKRPPNPEPETNNAESVVTDNLVQGRSNEEGKGTEKDEETWSVVGSEPLEESFTLVQEDKH